MGFLCTPGNTIYGHIIQLGLLLPHGSWPCDLCKASAATWVMTMWLMQGFGCHMGHDHVTYARHRLPHGSWPCDLCKAEAATWVMTMWRMQGIGCHMGHDHVTYARLQAATWVMTMWLMQGFSCHMGVMTMWLMQGVCCHMGHDNVTYARHWLPHWSWPYNLSMQGFDYHMTLISKASPATWVTTTWLRHARLRLPHHAYWSWLHDLGFFSFTKYCTKINCSWCCLNVALFFFCFPPFSLGIPLLCYHHPLLGDVVYSTLLLVYTFLFLVYTALLLFYTALMLVYTFLLLVYISLLLVYTALILVYTFLLLV